MEQQHSIEPWPALPWNTWQATCDTLHLFTQVAGKVKLALSPFLNEWRKRGLRRHPARADDLEHPVRVRRIRHRFDFIDHSLTISTSTGTVTTLALAPFSVAEFFRELMACLGHSGIDVGINVLPVKVPNPIPFTEDLVHASYDSEFVHRWWRILSVATLRRDAARPRRRPRQHRHDARPELRARSEDPMEARCD